jgi:hypothetical protein
MSKCFIPVKKFIFAAKVQRQYIQICSIFIQKCLICTFFGGFSCSLECKNCGKGIEYEINRQCCVVANEPRRRGFDVTSLPNFGGMENLKIAFMRFDSPKNDVHFGIVSLCL